MLLPVPAVMRQMIPLGFQRVVILVLDFPPRAPCPHKAGDVCPGDRLRGHKGIVVKAVPLRGSDRQFTPLDLYRIVGSPQGELPRVALRIDCQPHGGVVAVSHLVQIVPQVPALQLLIEGGMGVGLADPDKGHAFLDQHLTQGVVGV